MMMFEAIPHKERLATLHAICLQISLHLSKNLTTQSAYVRYETDSHISPKCS